MSEEFRTPSFAIRNNAPYLNHHLKSLKSFTLPDNLCPALDVLVDYVQATNNIETQNSRLHYVHRTDMHMKGKNLVLCFVKLVKSKKRSKIKGTCEISKRIKRRSKTEGKKCAGRNVILKYVSGHLIIQENLNQIKIKVY